MLRILVPFVLLVGCGSAGQADQVLADYASNVATMRSMVTQHVTQVGSAASVAEVQALEDAYTTSWEDQRDAMGDTMGMMDGCTMGGGAMMSDGNGMMDDMNGMMDAMDREVEGHMGDHASHTDTAMCGEAEATHMDHMGADFDVMDGYGDGMMGEGMMCGGMMNP